MEHGDHGVETIREHGLVIAQLDCHSGAAQRTFLNARPGEGHGLSAHSAVDSSRR